MPKINIPLTDIVIRNIKATDKPKKYYDGGGLYLYVSPKSGGKFWYLAYRFGGKQKTLSLGEYSIISLKDARDRRDDAKRLLANGVDPEAYKKAAEAAVYANSHNTFEIIAREWHSKQSGIWVESHRDRILSRLVKDIFPLIGNKPINSISSPMLLDVLRKIEDRGAIETAHRIMQICGQIFRYAKVTGRAECDITADLRGALSPAKHGNFASIKDLKEIGFLLRDIDAYQGNIVVKTALRLLPYVFVRSGELRHAEWKEIDFDKAEWRIPASRMKMKEIHIVPLSKQAIGILKELRPYTMHSQLVFPSMRENIRPISDMALLAALRRMGYDKETMTVHGFRSMASTLLNEQGYNRDWIERQLAHGERNKIRDAYNYAQYLDQRRGMMQEYADYLDALKADTSNKVISLRANGVIR